MFLRNRFDCKSPLLGRVPNYSMNSDICVIEIGYNRVPAGLCQILKRDVYILHYIADGKGIFMDQPFSQSHGYLVVPNELEVIKADAHDPYESSWVVFKGTLAPEILKRCNLNHHNCVFEFKRNKECIDIIKDAMFNREYANEAEEFYALQSVLFQIIAIHMKDIEEKNIHSNSIAQSVANYINNNYFGQVKIDAIAKNLHITRNYLCTLFKDEYNVSPQEYLISLRIEKAKQLLVDKQANLSVKEVAGAVGFENPLYFSRLFHNRTGMPPSEYRKSK